MSRVVILSKTKMSNGSVCVGAFDTDSHVSIRLLNSRGYHESANDCLYEVFDEWELDYQKSNNRGAPHTEDVVVKTKSKISVMSNNFDIKTFIKNNGVKLFEGCVQNIFEGCLKCNEKGRMYINSGNIPNYSTCYWVCDAPMYKDQFGSYTYLDPQFQWGRKIKYVGTGENQINVIPAGALVRFSLAHWWKPESQDLELRCYLQLSGIYV